MSCQTTQRKTKLVTLLLIIIIYIRNFVLKLTTTLTSPSFCLLHDIFYLEYIICIYLFSLAYMPNDNMNHEIQKVDIGIF